MRYVLFDPALEQQQRRNADQENPDRHRNECVDTRTIDSAQMTQKAHPDNRSGNTACGQCQNDLAPNRSFIEVNPAGTDFGNEVEEGVRSDCNNGGHAQDKNQDRQQEHTAAHPCHSDQGSYYEAD